MSLAYKLGGQFERRLQDRGRFLFEGGAVRITESAFDHVQAKVQGSDEYAVHVKYQRDARSRDNLLVSCTCAYFGDFGRCKHLWAVILEAGEQRLLPSAEYARYLRVERELVGGPVLLTQRSPHVYEAPVRTPQTPPWQEYLKQIQTSVESQKPPAEWPADLEILYAIDPVGSRTTGAMVIDLYSRTRKKNGELTVWKEFRVSHAKAGTLPDPVDADIVPALLGGTDTFSFSYSSTYASSTRKALSHALALKLLPRAAAVGRLALRNDLKQQFEQLLWDEAGPWRLLLEVRQDDRDQWAIVGTLARGEERMPLTEPALILPGGFVVARQRIAQLTDAGEFAWIQQLLSLKRIPFPDRERDEVLSTLLNTAHLPQLDVDQPLRFEERRAAPRAGLRITQNRNAWGEEAFLGRLLFDYGAGWVQDPIPGRGVWMAADRVFLLRDPDAEHVAREQLRTAGFRLADAQWSLNPKIMPRAVRQLLQAGWHVEANGKAFRRASSTRVDVTSGIDWFELRGEVDYGDGATARLPDLLAALRRGDTMVPLGDGSFGMLPEDWLTRFAPLANLGSREEDHLRFRQNQAGLLDVLLAAQPEVRVDEVFERARQRLRNFGGVQAAPQPEGFSGQLREYQREGLGWMNFLREFGFGGCLADDMGVGKTAQVLALLEARRVEGKGPSLVVAPKSLMFNWRMEAARFTPNLRVLEHTGIARDPALFREHDLILTTYGTMLRDAPHLAEMSFDYVVLDEAQAVKNASTASSKAVRLLRGDNRLALSGTPVENHLGELWSLFEFLNPGMLGEAKVLQMAGGLARNPSEDARRLLSQALRPFILRRTKQQVARELPEKTEQTIFCELDTAQRKQYEELRRHYRDTLLARVASEGMGKAKIGVLEALLRLRQAACHPGLLDPKRVDEGSAKIDTLLAQLDEVRQEGHKALVFSQFTSLLAILRRRLDGAGTRYAYLDGQTRDRQERVETFQTDPDCGLFLISLKAGGLGLNLTAAEYVFLLDPWWNPAVESQAIDRAHRIGQTRPVFAYRLIAKGTVEEKVIELQKTKRELADAILGEDNSLIRDLKREDLELLLS